VVSDVLPPALRDPLKGPAAGLKIISDKGLRPTWPREASLFTPFALALNHGFAGLAV
jgi:hypothetical protein